MCEIFKCTLYIPKYYEYTIILQTTLSDLFTHDSFNPTQ